MKDGISADGILIKEFRCHDLVDGNYPMGELIQDFIGMPGFLIAKVIEGETDGIGSATTRQTEFFNRY